jgi:hypothetical protein
MAYPKEDSQDPDQVNPVIQEVPKLLIHPTKKQTLISVSTNAVLFRPQRELNPQEADSATPGKTMKVVLRRSTR